MGNKIHVIGYRIGVSKDWSSKWFAENKDYGSQVIEDEKIRNFFESRLKTAGLENVLIERNLNEIMITLKVARPGVVIGRKGAGVNILRDDIKKMVDSKVSISVEEVSKPETSAILIADSLVHQITKRVHYKRAILSAMQRAKDQGVKGIKITASGVLSGANTISRTEPYRFGAIPQSTIKADIDYAEKPAVTTYGVIGIRVWVYK